MGKLCKGCGREIEPGAEVLLGLGGHGVQRIEPFHRECADGYERRITSQMWTIAIIGIVFIVLVGMAFSASM